MIRSKQSKLCIGVGVTGIALALATFAYPKPTFTGATYTLRNGTVVPFDMPLHISTDEHESLTVDFKINLSHAITSLHIIPDDCLEELIINDQRVATDTTPFCDYINGRMVDVSDIVHPGTNTAHALILNHSGPASFVINPSTTWLSRAGFLLAIVACFTIIVFMKTAWIIRFKSWAYLIVALASIAIRVLYYLQTEVQTRGYDSDGHIEYILHMIAQWSVPAAGSGWQFYQPPLYYLLLALPASFFGDKEVIVAFAQAFSLILSIGSLALVAWIVQHVFPKQSQLHARLLALGLYGFFPATVFLASRINNDVLLEFLILLFLGSLLHWWSEEKSFWFYHCALALGLAIITKSNALLLVPVFLLCILFKRKISLQEKILSSSIALIIIAGLSLWYTGIRHLEGQTNIVGNLSRLPTELRLETDISYLTKFNPIRIITQPYNNPWDDSSGRQFFFEYLYKSAFTGEFFFGHSLRPIASAMAFFGMIILLSVAIGFWYITRSSALHYLPLWLTPIVIIVGHIAFRQFIAPYSSSQDFRYSIGLLLPLIMIAVLGMETLPSAGNQALRIAGWSFITTCAIFLSSIGIV